MHFNWVDLVIVFFLIGSIGRGLQVGFFRQIFAVGGFFLGLFIGGWLMPHVVFFIRDVNLHALVSAMLVLLFAVGLSLVGDNIGERLHLALGKGLILKIESAAGVVISALSVLLAAWFIGAMLLRLPFEGLSNSVSNSGIIGWLDDRLPPAPTVFAQLNKIIGPNGFPKVFVNNEPRPSGPVTPVAADVKAATAKAAASTVKISGFGCGGIVSGSGFVIGNGLVATNAHVVAGVRRLIVHDNSGNRVGTPVIFDPNLDFAVLRVSGLTDPVLSIKSDDVDNSTTVAVLGYPGGGDFTSDPGVVLDKIRAMGRNIYDSGVTVRDVYELQADVEPGNSGGPLVLPDGTVAGVVFAKATDTEGYGYALTSKSILPEVQAAQSATKRVSTGACAAG